MAEEVHAQHVLADSQVRPSTQQRIGTQSTLASTKQQMQQVKTIDNPSGKVPKRAPGVNNATGNEAESAMSSTDHAQ